MKRTRWNGCFSTSFLTLVPLLNLDPKHVRVGQVEPRRVWVNKGMAMVYYCELHHRNSDETACMALTQAGELWCMNPKQPGDTLAENVGFVCFDRRSTHGDPSEEWYEPSDALNKAVRALAKLTRRVCVERKDGDRGIIKSCQ